MECGVCSLCMGEGTVAVNHQYGIMSADCPSCLTADLRQLIEATEALTDACWFNAKGGGIEFCQPDPATVLKAIQATDRANKERG